MITEYLLILYTVYALSITKYKHVYSNMGMHAAYYYFAYSHLCVSHIRQCLVASTVSVKTLTCYHS